MRGEGSHTIETPFAEPVGLLAFPGVKIERFAGFTDYIGDVVGKICWIVIKIGGGELAVCRRNPLVQTAPPRKMGIIVARADRADSKLEKKISFRSDQRIPSLYLREAEEAGSFQAEALAAAGKAAGLRAVRRLQGIVIDPIGFEVGNKFGFCADFPREFLGKRLAEAVDEWLGRVEAFGGEL